MLSFVAIICLATGFAQVNSQVTDWNARFTNNRQQYQNQRLGSIVDQFKQQMPELQQYIPNDPNIIQKYREDPRVESILGQLKQRAPELQQFINKGAPRNTEDLFQKYRQTFEDMSQQKNIPSFEPSRYYERFNKPSPSSKQFNGQNQKTSEESIESRAI